MLWLCCSNQDFLVISKHICIQRYNPEYLKKGIYEIKRQVCAQDQKLKANTEKLNISLITCNYNKRHIGIALLIIFCILRESKCSLIMEQLQPKMQVE